MIILSIDTTTDRSSIALTQNDLIIEERALPPGDRVGDLLFAEIEALLARNDLSLPEIDVFASASGPGTFTGVRIGLTAVKGLAEAMSRKVIAVSNLKAMAFFGSAPLRAPWLDARRGDIYGAVYNADLDLVHDEVVLKHDAWLSSLPPGAELLSEPRLLAGAIGRISAREFAAGRALDPAAVDANYVRRSDAAMMWKDSV